MIPRLQEQYNKVIIPNMQKKFALKNKITVPKLTKVVLNMGLGMDGSNKTILKNCIEDMGLISGQKPVTTVFKKSISNFKTRKGTIAGIKVTLRSSKMYEFIDRLVNIALPRIKDFQGLTIKGLDKFGGYSFGIKEHVIFPEINFDKIDRIRGMDITIVTTGKNKETTRALLEELNFPFVESEKKNIKGENK
jgi:large subunit ribosomal protein L5